MSALPAPSAGQRGVEARPEAGEFVDLEATLECFVVTDLVQARLSTARAELARLANQLADALDLAAAALGLDTDVVAERVAQFRAAADAQRQARRRPGAPGREPAALVRRLAAELAALAREACDRHDGHLAQVVSTALRRGLEDELCQAVEAAVRESFESFRHQEADLADHEWSRLAARFRARTEEWVNALRALAGDLLHLSLPGVRVPEVVEEGEWFFYLFLHVGTTGEDPGRPARSVLPGSVVRPRMLDRARRHVAEELGHAGRAPFDLIQRLDAVRRRVEGPLLSELDRTTVEAVLGAADRPEALRRSTEAGWERRLDEDAAAHRAARVARDVAEASARPEGTLGQVAGE